VRHALFDFDGTLSLLRAGWQQVMESYFCDTLANAVPTTPRCEHVQVCREFITRLTGQQTIFQALELEQHIRAAGATPLPAHQYKAEFLRRLHASIDHRLEALRVGRLPPTDFLIPGSVELLQALGAAQITCYLASGTDLANVIEETELLGLTPFFSDDEGGAPRIHGALEDYHNFSKRMVIEQIIADNGLSGPELVAFGDGFVEIEETRRVGGIAVAIASREDGGSGCDPWKARRLRQVGANLLVNDWRDPADLLRQLGIS
jgi:phosphoglycolate phosphatase-like HAD superfamily hydrolase